MKLLSRCSEPRVVLGRSTSPTARTLLRTHATHVPRSETTCKKNAECITLVERVFTGVDAWKAQETEVATLSWSILCGTLLAAGMLTIPCEGAWAVDHHVSMYDLAENEDFWANVLRYVSYFFSVLLGTAYVAFKPILELLKRPTTAVLVIGAAVGLYFFVSTTVSAMLGMNEYGYEPSSIVTPYVN